MFQSSTRMIGFSKFGGFFPDKKLPTGRTRRGFTGCLVAQ